MGRFGKDLTATISDFPDITTVKTDGTVSWYGSTTTDNWKITTGGSTTYNPKYIYVKPIPYTGYTDKIYYPTIDPIPTPKKKRAKKIKPTIIPNRRICDVD